MMMNISKVVPLIPAAFLPTDEIVEQAAIRIMTNLNEMRMQGELCDLMLRSDGGGDAVLCIAW